MATANGDGAFGLRLPESASGPERIEAGDIVTLEAGGQSAEITVEPLSFDWSEGAAIFGQAPANRPVQLRLRLKSGATYSIPASPMPAAASASRTTRCPCAAAGPWPTWRRSAWS
ncbi:MAG: hypothetical protein IPL60_17840 [Ardenticatenia bacterium]|nr:hypothetical protein [Ardenticatenia bacterium]